MCSRFYRLYFCIHLGLKEVKMTENQSKIHLLKLLNKKYLSKINNA